MKYHGSRSCLLLRASVKSGLDSYARGLALENYLRKHASVVLSLRRAAESALTCSLLCRPEDAWSAHVQTSESTSSGLSDWGPGWKGEMGCGVGGCGDAEYVKQREIILGACNFPPDVECSNTLCRRRELLAWRVSWNASVAGVVDACAR